MREIELRGCNAEPLMSYLKALGVLRVVAEQADKRARGAWRHSHFVFSSKLNPDGLASFFLNDYRPTPVVVPWSGNDFFNVSAIRATEPLKTTPTSSKIIRAFLTTKGDRLEVYRRALEKTLLIIRDMEITKKDIEGNSDKAKKTKAALIARLRSSLPETVIPWIDVAALTMEGSATFNVLLGSGGGNDGNTHFSDNFMQNLWDCLPNFDDQRTADSSMMERAGGLLTALFGSPSRSLIEGRTAALFDGGRVGGPNATQGKKGEALTNPWDFVFAIEGTLCLAGAVVRRHEAAKGPAPGFPFAVRMISAGYGTAVSKEAGQTEFWLPLWRRLMSLPELTLLFSEGRAEVGRRRVTHGIDFARAVASLGVDSGITDFLRLGIVKSRVGGDNHNTAVSLGRFPVHSRSRVNLLLDLERARWLENFRRACSAQKPRPPQRFTSALSRLESAVFNYCRHGGKRHFDAVLRAVGRIERELSLRGGAEVGGIVVNPAPVLTRQWLEAVDDGTPEFRIAAALASIRRRKDDKGKEVVGSSRSNLEPVAYDDRGWYAWTSKDIQSAWSGGSLPKNLIAVLERRLIEGRRHKLPGAPLDAASFAALDDVTLFIEGGTDDRRIEDLLWGLVLVSQATGPRNPLPLSGQGSPLPRSYALLKLLFLSGSTALKSRSDDSPIRCEPAILSLLRRGDIPAACHLAARRLRASGFISMPGPLSDGCRRGFDVVGSIDPIRMAAALLIPVADGDRLKNVVLRPIERLSQTHSMKGASCRGTRMVGKIEESAPPAQ